jgi:hypothetical protein
VSNPTVDSTPQISIGTTENRSQFSGIDEIIGPAHIGILPPSQESGVRLPVVSDEKSFLRNARGEARISARRGATRKEIESTESSNVV